MVAYKTIDMYARLITAEGFEVSKKPLSVLIISEDGFSFVTTRGDMVEGVRVFYP